MLSLPDNQYYAAHLEQVWRLYRFLIDRRPMKMGQLLFYCYINSRIDGYLRQYTYVRMNISMYDKMHNHAVSYFNIKALCLF